MRAKAEILNSFQGGVGFIPGEERDYECDDSDDQGQVFHQRLSKHLGAQKDVRSSPALMNSRQESRVWTPEWSVQRTTVGKS